MRKFNKVTCLFTLIAIMSCTGASFSKSLVIGQRLQPGATVSDIEGNTSKEGRRARFQVRLDSQPIADVVIALQSSDTSEGVVSPSRLTFTPDNWNQRQEVTVTGTNANVVDSTQDYLVMLLPALSTDSGYQGLDAEDVVMRGIVLELELELTSPSMTPGLEGYVLTHTHYSDYTPLTYELLNAPAGMVIEDGVVRWTPPLSTGGNVYSITVRVSDGVREDQQTLDITVAPFDVIQTAAQGNDLTVTDTGTNLDKFIFRFNEDAAAGKELKRIAVADLPDIPASLTRLSDVYFTAQDNTGSVEVYVPTTLLADRNDLGRLAIIYRLNGSPDYRGWSSGRVMNRLEEIDGVEYAVLDIASIMTEAFVGLKPIY